MLNKWQNKSWLNFLPDFFMFNNVRYQYICFQTSFHMNKLFLVVFLLAAQLGFAQTTASSTSSSTTTPALKLPQLDKSPMDMAYYPANYPVLKIQDKATEPLIARIIYSRPQKSNRTVFGELVEYNQVWRMGANDATEIEFYRDV